MNLYSPVSNTRCHSVGHKRRIARFKIRVESQGRWEEEEEENLFVNQINTVQNVSEETNDWLPKRASLSSWSPKRKEKEPREGMTF